MLKSILFFLFLIMEPLYALEIREPFVYEIKEISELYYHTWHDTYDVIAPHLSAVRTKENCLKKWNNYYKKGDKHFVLVAIQNKKIVGVLYAGPIEDTTVQECALYDSEVDKLYVASSMKNKGIGTQLLNAGFERLDALGFKKTVIRSLTKNKNTNIFYEKRGGLLLAQPTVSFNEKMNVYGFTISNRT